MSSPTADVRPGDTSRAQRLRAMLGPRSHDAGFTLIELLVVVVIIGVLIAIAIPLYLNYTRGSRDTSSQSDTRAAVSTLEQCKADNNGTYPSAIDKDTAAMTGCDSQRVKISTGTKIAYFPNTDRSGYLLEADNTGGNKAVYCYATANGGSITKIAGRTSGALDTTAPANLTCPAT